jgi:hypothetical protein
MEGCKNPTSGGEEDAEIEREIAYFLYVEEEGSGKWPHVLSHM